MASISISGLAPVIRLWNSAPVSGNSRAITAAATGSALAKINASTNRSACTASASIRTPQQDGTERLVSRGAYRLTDNQSGQITFQLHGNGYAFAPGHTAKLVLMGKDAPYLRASNDAAFTVQLSNVSVSLPTAAP